MRRKHPRLAVRAVIVEDARLLLVNAYPGDQSDLWCVPGGGVEPGASLPDNLIREVAEETGLKVAVGTILGVNEFHNPDDGFHQVDIYFAARITSGRLDQNWVDPEGVVTRRRWVTEAELRSIRHKPDSLDTMAFRRGALPVYDRLETIVG